MFSFSIPLKKSTRYLVIPHKQRIQKDERESVGIFHKKYQDNEKNLERVEISD